MRLGAIDLALTASLVNAQKFYFHAIREPAFRLPAIMLQPSNSLDFRRQRHHVKLSALMWMLTFWPRDERSPFSLLACNLVSFGRPGHVGASPQNSIAAAAPDFPARARRKESPTFD